MLTEMRGVFWPAALVGLLAPVAIAAGCGGGGAEGGAATAENLGEPVSYAQVQGVFEKYGCTACHPGVNPALDLTEGKSYDQLVGVRALEDPTLYRVVAGDPERSFLYLKVGGAPPVADIPAIGTRMPPQAPPIDQADMDLIRRWILQGAKDVDGQTKGPTVPSPGNPPTDLDVAAATETTGTATVAGSVIGQDRDPIEGALVTMLLAGPDQPGGEEHYRVVVTDEEGRFRLEDAPSGRYLLKAYGPNTIYVSRIVALEEGETQEVAFGLPDRVVENPKIARPTVEETSSGTTLSMDVQGSDLDPNYTLAVNPDAGLVFELRSPGDRPGTWSATIDEKLEGPWIFMAVDKTCNVSDFLTVSG
jgi:Carboxypeptidase regulatory-like domain